MKKTIRMNERELHRMISESVKRVLTESIDNDLYCVVEAGYAYLQRPVFEGTYDECEEYIQTNYARDGYMIMSIDEYQERFDDDYEHFRQYGL